jgi:hypothetical protein
MHTSPGPQCEQATMRTISRGFRAWSCVPCGSSLSCPPAGIPCLVLACSWPLLGAKVAHAVGTSVHLVWVARGPHLVSRTLPGAAG